MLLAGLALPLAAATQPGFLPRRLSIAVAGPAGGVLDQAGRGLTEGMMLHLPPGTVVTRTPIGGLDGVTGANDFAAQEILDGSAAMLVPGVASLAWLAGDARVHFDPARWLPVLARTAPAFVITRAGSPIRPGSSLRVASSGTLSPALAAMLALDLLGADVHAAYGLNDEMAALTAVQSGQVDAALLRGTARLPMLHSRFPSVAPLFTFGAAAPGKGLERAIDAPTVPTLVEYGATIGRRLPASPRFDAWNSAAAAAQLQYALVLPGLTPPAAVAMWREAGAQALAPDLANSFDVVYSSAASLLMRSICPEAAALLALRSWLADRLGWQPG